MRFSGEKTRGARKRNRASAGGSRYGIRADLQAAGLLLIDSAEYELRPLDPEL